MSAARMEMDRLMELVRLHRMGKPRRELCRMLVMSPKTVTKYVAALRSAGLLEGDPSQLPEAGQLTAAVTDAYPVPEPGPPLETRDWEDDATTMFASGVRAKAAFDALRSKKPGVKASYSSVKRAYRRWLKSRPVREEDVVLRVETGAGEVAQVDFGEIRPLIDPLTQKVRRAWVFIMTLGYSRHSYAEIVFDQSAETWQRLHVNAFAWFGGVPRTVVPDNLKAAVVRASFDSNDRHKLQLNRNYRTVARYYGFTVDPTPVRSPQKKGKVESFVRYVKQNWQATCTATTLPEANAELWSWLRVTAGMRIHGTTGKQPLLEFEQNEKPHLQPLPTTPFVAWTYKQAQVHLDAHVEHAGKLYSVPWQYIGQTVMLHVDATSVLIFVHEQRIATHERIYTGRRSTQEQHLPAHRHRLVERGEVYWVALADKLHPDVGTWARALMASDRELSKLRELQAAVSLLERYPPCRARAAALRASHFGNFSYQELRRILNRALDLEPLPGAAEAPVGVLRHARYSRSPDSYQLTCTEEPHEPT
jgi:transposase